MEPSDLKLVRAPGWPSSSTAPRERAAAVGLGLLALGAALVGTLLGADRSREPTRPVDTAREALFRVLDRGPTDPGVRELLGELRLQIGQRPLDARTRALYSALLLEMAMGAEVNGQLVSSEEPARIHKDTAAEEKKAPDDEVKEMSPEKPQAAAAVSTHTIVD